MKYLIILSLCFLSTLGIAQDQDIAGYWKGTITQDAGGYRSSYVMELWISQKGDSIVGKSFVFVDDIYAEMKVSGSFHSGVYLQMKDDEIITHEELEGMEWCIKSYQLLLKKNGQTAKLEGHWQGQTTFSSCIPGRIELTKGTPKT